MRTVKTIILLACLLEPCAAQMALAQLSSDAAGANGGATGETVVASVEGKGRPMLLADADSAEPQDEKPAPKPAPPKSKLDKKSSVLVDVGYADWALRGNQSKFLQYATPPSGFFLRDLRYAPLLKSPSESALFDLRAIGQSDYRASGRAAWDYGATRFSGFLSSSKFYDPNVGIISPSVWKSQGIDLRRAISKDFSLSFQARSNSQQLNYAIPYPGLDQNTDFWSAAAGGKLGPGSVLLDYSNFHYADSTQTLANFDAQKVGLSYLWTPIQALGIEAGANHVSIRQPEVALSHVDTLSLGGDLAIGSGTDLLVNMQRRQVAVPNVQNAYVRNSSVETVRISQYIKSWRAQIGLKQQNDDRVNGTQTAVDVPKWSTLDARLSGRIAKTARLTLRGYTQTLSDPPASVLADPLTLYWTSRNFAQAKLESGTENVNGYLVYTYQVNRNSQRQSDVTTGQYTLGGTWQINQGLSLFAEYHHENWTGRIAGDSSPVLSDFLPNADTGVLELNWTLSRRAYVAVSYSGFANYNANPLLLQDGNTRGSTITFNTHYRFPAGYELGVLVAPKTYRDTVVNAMNYDATVLMITGSARF